MDKLDTNFGRYYIESNTENFDKINEVIKSCELYMNYIGFKRNTHCATVTENERYDRVLSIRQRLYDVLYKKIINLEERCD